MFDEMITLSEESEINMFFFAQELKISNENVQKKIEKIYESFLNTYGYDYSKIDIYTILSYIQILNLHQHSI